MRIWSTIAGAVVAIACVRVAPVAPFEAPARPNVVVLLADDMGYADLGCYGGEIETPNLDGLAADGLRFTQFYTTGRCWPTRASLLTGYYAQQIRRDQLMTHPVPIGERPAWAPLLPAVLRTAGYRSYHSGKWHIDGMPLAGGFDHSYLLEDQGRFFNPQVHYEDDRPLPPVAPESGYYATTAIADHAIRQLREHQAAYPDRPFFAYVAFTAPHFPLQALAEDIARYRDTYRIGWDRARMARWLREKDLGLIRGPLSRVEYDLGPPYPFPGLVKVFGPGEVDRPIPWRQLTDEQREFQATKMAIHAAMVDRMDQEIGRLLGQLRAMTALDDTLVLFLSDNGASSEILVRDDGHDPEAEPGSGGTHLCLGPGWATVSNAPFRRHKTWVHEGGIATPLIVHWPKGIAARGELRETPGHVVDVVPTILQIAGVVPTPGSERRAPPKPGRSLVPAFGADVTIRREYLWWLHEGNRAIRVGDHKLVTSRVDDKWELYDLAGDRAESKDLASDLPHVVGELAHLWERKAKEFERDSRTGFAPRH